MKRTLLMAAALLMIAAPMAKAQDTSLGFADIQEINVGKYRAALKKADATVANPAKAIKAASWVKRGDAYLAAGADPTNGVFAGLNETVLVNSIPAKTQKEAVTIGGNTYTCYHCENFDAYTINGIVAFVIETNTVVPNALDTAYTSYAKAYNMSKKTGKKVGDGMTKIMNKEIQLAQGFYGLNEFAKAGQAFYKAYTASVHPTVNKPDTTDLYNAALTATYGGDYANGLKYIDEVMKLNYFAKGAAFYYKFFCLYKLDRKAESLDVLKDGLSMFPGNTDIVESMLSYYAEDKNSNPDEIIPVVMRSIAKDPANPNLHFGMGRIYEKLGKIDKAIDEVRTAVSLKKDDFFFNYYLGMYILEKGDQQSEDLNKLPLPTNAESKANYDKVQEMVNATYASAIEPLEIAYRLNPKEPSTVELLKNVTFRLRDTSKGMQAKYEFYNNAFKAMQ